MAGRYQRGHTNPVFAPILTAQAAAVADLVSLSSGNVVRAQDVTWATAVATPSAPTVTNGAVAFGTSLTNAATGVKVSYQFPWGEGPLSAAGSVTPTAAAAIKLAGQAIPSPAYALNVYVETAAASGIYKLYASFDAAIGQGGIGDQMIFGYGAGQVPPTAALSDATTITQYNFAQAFLGVSGQTKAAAVARVDANGVDNIIRVDTSGIFLYDLASATTVAVGDFFAPAKDTGNALLSQKLAAVTAEQIAVARAVVAGTSLTQVYVEVLSMLSRHSRMGM